jgi:ribosomal protein S18 acetylase RimI-like enzyme
MKNDRLYLRIRPFEEGDMGAVVGLWEACGLVVPQNDPVEDISFCRASGHGEVFVGELDGEIVAACMAGHEGHRGWVYYVAVRPDLQRKGLGKQIMRHAETWLLEQGVPKIQLMVRESNEDVCEFYQRIGYSRDPVIVMSKRFRSADEK